MVRIRMSKRGFTMVELLVVVAVMSVLVLMLLPAMSRSREAGRAAVCTQKFHDLALMLASYESDYKNRFVTGPTSGGNEPTRTGYMATFMSKRLGAYYANGTGDANAATGLPSNGAVYYTAVGWVNGPLRCPSVTPDITNTNIRKVLDRWYYTGSANFSLNGLLVNCYSPGTDAATTAGYSPVADGYLNARPLDLINTPNRVVAAFESPSTGYGDSIRDYYYDPYVSIASSYWGAWGTYPRFMHFDDGDALGTSQPRRQGSSNQLFLDGSVKMNRSDDFLKSIGVKTSVYTFFWNG